MSLEDGIFVGLLVGTVGVKGGEGCEETALGWWWRPGYIGEFVEMGGFVVMGLWRKEAPEPCTFDSLSFCGCYACGHCLLSSDGENPQGGLNRLCLEAKRKEHHVGFVYVESFQHMLVRRVCW